MKRILGAVAIVAAALFLTPIAAQAMPPFAQAYGVNCTLCHTQVPTLNAYGRYVQRTGYASLDPHVLRRAFPVWIGEQANYDSTNQPVTPQFGNLAIHIVGAIGNDFTYHGQQWIWADNGAGDLDTLWIAYNNILHRDGHLFVGLIESPGPSGYSMWADVAPFQTPEIVVGEHAYQVDGNRWGAKLNYIKNDLDLEAGWLYQSNGWSGASDFINTDKTFAYKIGWANPVQPLEVGFLGSRGSVPVSTGTDQYYSYGGYAQRDPTGWIPGALVLYQRGYDNNPGADPNTALPYGPANSSGLTTELYQTFFQQTLWLSVRKEWENDGLGNLSTPPQSGSIDASYTIAKYLRLYTEVYMQQNSGPVWRYYLWWTTPLHSQP